MVNMRADKYVYLDNGAYELTDEDKNIMQENWTNINVVQTRVDNGWDIKDAIRLNKRFVIRDGEFKARISGGGKVCYLNEETIENAFEQGMTYTMLDHRIRQGVHVLKEYIPSDVIDHKLNRLIREDRERAERAELIRQEREREKKPHLYNGTPQKHERSKWCEYLMKTSIYPKAVH
ncbi:MAG TPA: hypothetical protein H9885_08520 [Candidatus Jeotgalicoccus stercoravium]|nr:hypothetical protein [Candidatus Jeotgalicoccus stercoravium]